MSESNIDAKKIWYWTAYIGGNRKRLIALTNGCNGQFKHQLKGEILEIGAVASAIFHSC
jgi:hypothetical protein